MTESITVIEEVFQVSVTESLAPVVEILESAGENITVVEEVVEVIVTDSPAAIIQILTPGTQGSPGIQGEQGDQGIPGPPGTGSSISLSAGETIPGHRAIAIVGGLALLADPSNLAHASAAIAVVRDAYTVGQPATAFLSGEVNGGAFVADQDYFVGPSGVLSPAPSALGAVWQKRIGTAKDANALIVQMDPTILL